MKKNELFFYQLLRDYLNDYLIVRRNFSVQTLRTYRQSLNQFRLFLSDQKGIPFDAVDFSCFSRKQIYEYLIWLRDDHNCATETLNLRLSAIKSFLKYCSEEELELTSVYLQASSIHAFKGTKNTRVEYLTQPQLKLLFNAPDISTRLGRRNRFFLILAYETGGRMQELLDIKIGGIIHSETNVKVRILGKGSKIRYVPLMDSTLKHLDSYLAEFHVSSGNEDYLFYTVHDRKKTQMKPGTVDYFLKKYGKQLHKLESDFPANLHAHMLRHSIAMAMYKKGIPISYVKDFLGHSSLMTTAIYSYADEETIAKALESIDHEEFDNKGFRKEKKWKGKEAYLLEYCGLV